MKTFGVIVALLACGGCSNDMACGCPAAGPKPTLFASRGQLNFTGTGSAYAQTVTLTAPHGENGNVTESDDCTTAAGSIVTVQLPAASETPLTVVVTPMMGGTCSIGFVNSFGGGQIPVSIAVSPGG